MNKAFYFFSALLLAACTVTASNATPKPSDIPNGCVTWFDGCNTCSVTDGKPDACTEMACPGERNPPSCVKFAGDAPVATANDPHQSVANIPANCIRWSDGCNSCNVVDGKLDKCTESNCHSANRRNPGCMEFADETTTASGVETIRAIPRDCTTRFDGCTNCSAKDGKLMGCTRKACATKAPAKCVSGIDIKPFM